MTIIYTIITILSLLLMIAYVSLIKKKNIWMCLLFTFIFIINLGYLMLSISNTLEFAIFSNIIAYFGSAYLPIFMLIIVLDACDIKRAKAVPIALLTIATIVFIMVLSQAWSNLYYSSVILDKSKGYSKLVKEYGPLHLVYMIYLLTSFISMITIILYSFITKIRKLNKKAIFLASIVFGNIGVWAIEQFIDVDFEFLSASYLLSEFAILFLYWIAEDYFESSIIPLTDISTQLNKYDEYLLHIQNSNVLSNRELDVLKAILDNKKRKDIAEELNVSENTVKTHTRRIFEKLEVQNRQELFNKADRFKD